MFVQSARFVAEHQKKPAAELAICGVEKTDETGRLAWRIAGRSRVR
jgi:type I restriction enzyme M protein